MPPTAIEIENVSKRYIVGQHHGGRATLRDAIVASRDRLLKRDQRPVIRELWSLRDVSLEIAEGETVGLIGRNGAGKSTLLKIVTRITEPTLGVSRTRGRVGVLLEVGTGFHPELTGRENVYLNGAILGMSRRTVAQRFDDIAEFAGVERFLDTPVKRYSSGMYLRLAFAVAAHMDTDILAIDEVLAVGDAEFQHRCLNKVSSLKAEGRTVIFVSHDLTAVSWLCRNAIWLDRGRIRARGPTHEVVREYLSSGTSLTGSRRFPEDDSQPASVLELRVLDSRLQPTAVLRRDEPMTIEARFVVREHVRNLDMTAFLTNLRGVKVLEEAWSDSTAIEQRGAPGEYIARLTVPPVLMPDEYAVGLWLGSVYDAMFYSDDILRIRLDGGVQGRPDRLVRLDLPWDVHRAASEDAA